MKKIDIINILDKYNFDKNEFIIISGAALVLLGIKESTSDIDIAVSDKLYLEILNKYKCVFESIKNNNEVWFLDNIINFSKNYIDSEYDRYLGYKIQSLESIYELKLSLNRDKDQSDIKAIKKVLKK